METTSVSGKPASRRRHPAVARNIHNLPISFSIQSQLPGKISRSVLAGLYIYERLSPRGAGAFGSANGVLLRAQY